MAVAQRALLMLWCVVVAAGPIRAQQAHIVDAAGMDQALAERAQAMQAKRQTIRTALQQPDVQKVADRLGLDIARADAAVATLDGGELDRAAAQAQAVNDEIAGGQTVRLNLLWVIIGLLVIILIIVAS